MLIIIRNALVILRSLSVKSPFMRKDTVIFDTSVLFKKIGARKKTAKGNKFTRQYVPTSVVDPNTLNLDPDQESRILAQFGSGSISISGSRVI